MNAIELGLRNSPTRVLALLCNYQRKTQKNIIHEVYVQDNTQKILFLHLQVPC